MSFADLIRLKGADTVAELVEIMMESKDSIEYINYKERLENALEDFLEADLIDRRQYAHYMKTLGAILDGMCDSFFENRDVLLESKVNDPSETEEKRII